MYVDFLLPTTPAFAHPLLKNLTFNTPIVQPFDIKKLGNHQKESSTDFLDPLGASASNLFDKQDVVNHNSESVALNDKNGKKLSDIDVIAAGFLNNTLRQETKDVLQDFDLHLVGFRPWTEIRSKILDSFRIGDRFSIETRYMILINNYLIYRYNLCLLISCDFISL